MVTTSRFVVILIVICIRSYSRSYVLALVLIAIVVLQSPTLQAQVNASIFDVIQYPQLRPSFRWMEIKTNRCWSLVYYRSTVGFMFKELDNVRVGSTQEEM